MGEILKTKETITNFNALKERFDQFADIENINELTNVFLPRINHVNDHIDEMKASNVEMRECISEFDRSLTLKCNKSSIE